ncbi:MAG: ribosome small subunit-dependent GTPase A [Ostreibacterium sp.]
MARKPLSRRTHKNLTNKQKIIVNDNVEKRIEKLRQEKALEATVISHMGYNIIVQTSANSPLLACDWRQNIGRICAGDQVLITEQSNKQSDNNYRIEAILPRQNVIEKQNIYRGAKPFASNIDQILVIITHQPMFQASLLDRYIIMSNVVGIDCLVYFNKVDILTNADTIAHINRIRVTYQAIPRVNWVSGSIKMDNGLDKLKERLNDRKTVITGQSGVGKSTLINALIPDMNVQTMSISQASGLGRHSTTNSTLYRLNQETKHGSILIDTPGVRSFDTYHLTSEQIINGFTEIKAFLGHCQFSDCSHTHEKGCAVLGAIEAGKISQLRYESFLQILTESQYYDRQT